MPREGLGRSYQKAPIFLPFTVRENGSLASQSRARQSPWNPMTWIADVTQNTTNSIANYARSTRDTALQHLGV